MAAISTLSAEAIGRDAGRLAELLRACVEDGASINFVLPFPIAEAEAFWTGKVLPEVRRGGLLVLAAEMGDRLAGSVQLDFDTPPNQPHRAGIRKLMVHPDFRRRGIARALMEAAHAHATRLGRTLLTLDTRTGDAAEPLYAALGYVTAGVIPGYALNPLDGRPEAASFLYRQS